MSDYFLADDLSGALDAAAAFHRAGRRVRIALEAGAWSSEPGAITGLTTESRNVPPADAAAAVTAALAEGARRGARLVYKKIDSTLRGPVAAELAALRAAQPGARVLFCPANPAAGRTVRDGVLLVRGVPVAETEFARDPANPVRESSIRALLGAAADAGVTIADAGTEAELETAVAAMAAAGGPWVAVGSGALARPVAALRGRGAADLSGENLAPGAVLLVCGSAHAANRAQIAALARARGVPVCEASVAEPARAAAEAAGLLRAAGAAVLALETTRADSQRALVAIADAAVEAARAGGARRMFVTGGETAFAICARLGVRALDFVAELEPGLAVAQGGGWRFAVKPGGFGDAATWIRAHDFLRGGPAGE